MTRQGYGSLPEIILIGEHAVTFGQPAIAIPFNAGKIKILIESMEEGITLLLQVMYMTVCYDAPEHLKSIVNRFYREVG